MIGRVRRVLAVARGAYVPVLQADWTSMEHDVARRWLAGDDLGDAPDALARALGTDDHHVRVVNLGRSAIRLALEAMTLPAGSGVIVPSYACTGVVAPVIAAGLRPVLADIGDDLNLTLETVADAWAADPSASALVLPHFGGVAARDAEAIVVWARDHGLRVIEDAAHAQGLTVAGRELGTLGDAAIFSSGGGKPLTGPGGGWVVTADSLLAERIAARELPGVPREVAERRLRAFVSTFVRSRAARGRTLLRSQLPSRRPTAPAPADDQRVRFATTAMADVDAALALSQLPRLNELIARRRDHAALWRAPLEALEGPRLRVAPRENNSATVFWLSIRGRGAGIQASEARTLLWRHGIETQSLYVPLHRRPEITPVIVAGVSRTEALWEGVFAVPVGASLRDGDRARIQSAAQALAEHLAGG